MRRIVSFVNFGKWKKRGFINEVVYGHCYPPRSQLARLYELPKVDKSGILLRPILSTSSAFSFGIAQLLVHKPSHLIEHPTVIVYTFKFVDELHSLEFDMTTHKLVSFDVISLFTKVPLKQTINIILDNLYKDKCYCSHISDKKKKMQKEEKYE